MRVIYTSKGMSKKFGVRVIYEKYGISNLALSTIFKDGPSSVCVCTHTQTRVVVSRSSWTVSITKYVYIHLPFVCGHCFALESSLIVSLCNGANFFCHFWKHRRNWLFGIACRWSAVPHRFHGYAGNGALIVSITISEIRSHMVPYLSSKKGRGAGGGPKP